MALRSTRGARKSEVADPSLYEEEDEDDSPIEHPSNTSRTSVPSKKSAMKVAAPPRRSGRLSIESTSTIESPIAKPTTKQSKSRVKTTTTTTATPSKNGKKGKAPAGSLVPQSRTREERDREDGNAEEGNVDYQEDGELGTAATADGQKDKSKKARVAESTATTGRKFMPRAAEVQGKPAKAQPKYDHQIADSSGFVFTTNPPTPAPAKSKRPAAQARANPKQKAVKKAAPISSEDESQPGPVPSTSQLDAYSSPAQYPNHSGGHDSYVSLNIAETPKHMKNLAMRGDGAKGTPASGRRQSVDRMRGKRASTIGNGNAALPHDRVADDQLYRLLDADAPYTPRVKSLLRWLAHRKRDQLPFIQASRSSAERAPTPTAAQSMATELIDDFIAGLSDRSITFIAEPSAKPINAKGTPHPLNVANQKIYEQLVSDYDLITAEESQRQAVTWHYDKFTADRHLALKAADAAAGEDGAVPCATPIALSLEDVTPTLRTVEDVLSLGKALLEGKGDYRKGMRALAVVNMGSIKGKEKEVVLASDSNSTLLQQQLAEIPLQTAHLRLLSHRLANFSGLSSAYIQTRDRLSHLSLTEASQQGLSNHPTTTATSDPDATGGIADIVRRLAAVPSSSSNSSVPVTVSSRSLDPRDLLRSIAQADSKGR